MNGLRYNLARDYSEALESYVVHGGEEALLRAYKLGRTALNDGLGVLDMAVLHHEALGAITAGAPPSRQQAYVKKAAEFLAETLSPFEMTLRGYQETNARLMVMNETLGRANAEIKESHERLTAEVAERQRAEDALRQAQKLQVVGQLAGGVAHDFNNLLTVVLGNLDLARQRTDCGEAMGKLLSKAQYAAERGAKVTKQLLAFSRQQILQPEIIVPTARLLDIVSLLDRSLKGDIEVKADVPADLWAVEIDPAQLELALLNLGLNARDAMAGGGILGISAANRTVRDERLGLDGDYLVIEIADTGSGIDPEVLPHVFEPFFTTKDVGAGSGLGLSQVHGFMHQSGGAVDIDSRVGSGTIVRLYLPASHKAEALAAPSFQEFRVPSGTVTILVVEDDASVADFASELLQQNGFKVKLAYRAQAALTLLQQGETIDLIFSDITMPDGMNGIELAEAVRKNYPDVPVLLGTGYSAAAADAVSKGLDILVKPYRSDELRDRINQLLGVHRR